MSPGESVRIALRALRAHKLRSFLTMLGMIIGVASVLAMVAIGLGAQAQIDEQIRSMGANIIMVEPAAASDAGARLQRGTHPSLTEADAMAIARHVPHIRAAAPSISRNGQVVRGNRNANTIVNGTLSDYFLIRDWPLRTGRYFTAGEETGAAKVALIGTTIAKDLFGDDNPLGASIRVGHVPVEIVGVLTTKGMSGWGSDQDDVIFLPLSTARIRFLGSADTLNRESVDFILAKAVSDAAMVSATEEIKELLRQRHRLRSDQADDFTIIDPAQSMAAQNAAAATFAWLLAAIASVSLLVGGISIMNIMLVSVSERTREIGLRLAVGARRRDIRRQFLVEAIVLCTLGGLIGLTLGVGVSAAVARLAGWPVFLGPGAALLAVGFAGAVGLFFGYYPARKAARLDPVEALRTE